ncbi:DEAD/DEAH box helicase [Eubacteriales bacterium OttesenSCG-928-M02]|nr:DEAD/DEAH box helicase [Eubacteriales bacterium OttesenSCG-928-M02]
MNELSFSALGVSIGLVKSLSAMGLTQATPVQKRTIAPFLKGQDLIVQAPTGTGKTAAFGIPVCQMAEAENRRIETLILCPTRELALQTAQVIRQMQRGERKAQVVTIYGGENIQKQFAALRRNPQIVVATPGRLVDHIKRRTIQLKNIQRVVLDEADRMLDMGFRDDLDGILEKIPQERQTVLFSATLSREILQIASLYLREDAMTIRVKQKALTVDTVKQYYTQVKEGKKGQALFSLLEEEAGLVLVFVNTKRMADRLSGQLQKRGYRADALHGDMRQKQRDRVMQQYKKGGLDILVATDVAARGIDVDNIRMVVNYDIPQDSDSYVHRIGRTGRAKKEGTAYTLILQKELGKLKGMMREIKVEIPARKAVMG